MFESEHKLRHMPFFEEIAVHDEDTPEWRSATAGLLVLRLVDNWLDHGPGTSPDSWSIASVRQAIEAMNDGTPIKSILGRVIDALERQKPDIHVVVTPLMAYGRALEYDAKWALATDLYHCVLAHLHPSEDSDASIAAHLCLGSCYQNLSRMDDAHRTYLAAFEIAAHVNDIVGALKARIGEARIAMLRGNLPRAEEILDETIVRAYGEALRDVRSRALHHRANVAHLRQDYEFAIQLAYQALGQAEDATQRDRILGDIAASFLDLGVYSAARDAYMVLSATAQEQYVRWAATLNLIEISAQTGAQTLFELYRRQMDAQKLPSYLAAAYHLMVGEGYARFGQLQKARTHLTEAMSVASKYGHNQHLFDAEEALLTLDIPAPPPKTTAEPSLDLQEVASAIRELRELSGVG